MTHPPYFICLDGELYDLSSPTVMGIVNLTPDSFHADSRVTSVKELTGAVRRHLDGGAQIIDIGGYSSRPGAADIDEKHEKLRVLWGLECIRQSFDKQLPISVDTFRSSVVREAVEHFGPVIVNDITAGEGDPDMLDTVAHYKLPYIAMHMRGTPATMSKMTDYDDVTAAVIAYFAERMELFRQKHLGDVIIDPGFGFAKTVVQNFELLRRLDEFDIFDKPILVGLSRKTMIWRTLDIDASRALNGTTALHMAALERGANILRVHDSREAMQAVRLFEAIHGKVTPEMIADRPHNPEIAVARKSPTRPTRKRLRL